MGLVFPQLRNGIDIAWAGSFSLLTVPHPHYLIEQACISRDPVTSIHGGSRRPRGQVAIQNLRVKLLRKASIWSFQLILQIPGTGVTGISQSSAREKKHAQ